MSEPADYDDLGGGVDRRLMQRIVRRDVLSIPGRDASDPSAMLQPAVELVEKAFATLGRRRSKDCAFLLSEYPDRDQAIFPDMKPSRHLRRQRAPSVFGLLHVVTSGLDWALSVDVDCGDLEALHDWLSERSLEHRPAAVVEDRRAIGTPVAG